MFTVSYVSWESQLNNQLMFVVPNHTPHNNSLTRLITAYPGHRAVQGASLRPLACWDCGFESRCLSLVIVMCYQVEVCATGRSQAQSNPAECVCVCTCACVCVCVCVCVSLGVIMCNNNPLNLQLVSSKM
jgi:hypothetical protein